MGTNSRSRKTKLNTALENSSRCAESKYSKEEGNTQACWRSLESIGVVTGLVCKLLGIELDLANIISLPLLLTNNCTFLMSPSHYRGQ
jgi:hypothetical protein